MIILHITALETCCMHFCGKQHSVYDSCESMLDKFKVDIFPMILRHSTIGVRLTVEIIDVDEQNICSYVQDTDHTEISRALILVKNHVRSQEEKRKDLDGIMKELYLHCDFIVKMGIPMYFKIGRYLIEEHEEDKRVPNSDRWMCNYPDEIQDPDVFTSLEFELFMDSMEKEKEIKLENEMGETNDI